MDRGTQPQAPADRAGTLAPVSVLARASWRRRWHAVVVAGLLFGIAAGVGLGSLAGDASPPPCSTAIWPPAMRPTSRSILGGVTPRSMPLCVRYRTSPPPTTGWSTGHSR